MNALQFSLLISFVMHLYLNSSVTLQKRENVAILHKT